MYTPSPLELLALIEHQPGTAWIAGDSPGDGLLVWEPEAIATDLDSARSLQRQENGVFPGGVVGYISYEQGLLQNRLKTHSVRTPEPQVYLGRYSGGLRWSNGRWIIEGSPEFSKKASSLLTQAKPLPPPPPPFSPHQIITWSKAEWIERVEQILHWIREGDCYQINLTRPVQLIGIGDAFPAWQRLWALYPAPHAAFLRLPNDLAILCNSPELLLQGDRARIASSPIKGTRPRHSNPTIDQINYNELLSSEKEIAELTMIVDLMRNDFGRIAIPGTIGWNPRTLTTHPNVFHAEQTITANLRPDIDIWEALSSLLPPGSVTGTPKIRACERITDLETSSRGVYCGTIGWSSDSGRHSWNVAIRTAVWTPDHGGSIRYQVGGGIVADSNPEAEWQETIAKGEILAKAFGG